MQQGSEGPEGCHISASQPIQRNRPGNDDIADSFRKGLGDKSVTVVPLAFQRKKDPRFGEKKLAAVVQQVLHRRNRMNALKAAGAERPDNFLNRIRHSWWFKPRSCHKSLSLPISAKDGLLRQSRKCELKLIPDIPAEIVSFKMDAAGIGVAFLQCFFQILPIRSDGQYASSIG